MKKLLAASLLTLTLALSALAGETPLPGGYTCPTGKICVVNRDGSVTVSDGIAQSDPEEDSLTAWLYALIFGA